MHRIRTRLVVGMVALLGALSCGWLLLDSLAAQQPDNKKVTGEQLRPKWNVGDVWLIETSTLPTQERSEDRKPEPTKAKWEFKVVKDDAKVHKYDCYQVEVQCKDEPDQPKSTLWVEKKTMTLRQFQTQIPVPGGFKKIVESYATDNEQPAVPVVGPLSVLPIDLPFFRSGESKAAKEEFSYEAVSSELGKKDIKDIGFAIPISQQVATVKPADVKGLVIEDLRKGLDEKEKPVVEVNLEVAGRKVRQLWQSGYPWPVFSDNGSTQMRLLKFTPAKK